MADEHAGPVERFFEHLSARRWESLRLVLDPAVERVGPFGDRVDGRDRYLAMLGGTVPDDYGNDVLRITYGPDGRSAFARVTEHLVYDEPRQYHLDEVYSFELTDEGLIRRVEVYWQTPQLDRGTTTARVAP